MKEKTTMPELDPLGNTGDEDAISNLRLTLYCCIKDNRLINETKWDKEFPPRLYYAFRQFMTLFTTNTYKRIQGDIEPILPTICYRVINDWDKAGFHGKEKDYDTAVAMLKAYANTTPSAPTIEGNNQPQQEEPRQTQQPKKKRGRPIESLEDCMINDEDGSKLECLRKVMRGKKGKKAALMILACMEKGWMTKPTYGQVATTFGDIGRQQGFTPYLDEKRFSDIEIKGAMKALL